MKTVYRSLRSAFIIVGSVIGAGFASGREVVSFFYGQDLLFTCLLLFVCFFFGFSFLLIDGEAEDNVLFKCTKPLLLFANLIIMSGMLSGLDSAQQSLFGLDHSYPVLSSVCLIISNIILYNDVKGIGKVTVVLVPFMIAVILLTAAVGGLSVPPTSFTVSPVKIVEYVGLNAFISAILFMRVGRGEKSAVNLLAALIASAVICALIYVIGGVLFTGGNAVIYADIPLLSYAQKYAFLTYPFGICLVCGVFTTLLSSHYPLFLFVENERFTAVNRIILSVIALIVARLGFYNIVSYAYPVLGMIGAFVLTVIFVLQVFFRAGRRPRTSDRRERKV